MARERDEVRDESPGSAEEKDGAQLDLVRRARRRIVEDNEESVPESEEESGE